MDVNLPPPDIELMAQAFDVAGVQLRRVNNIPQFNEGTRILNLLQQIQNDVQGIKTDVHQVKTDVQHLKTDVQHLKTDVQHLKTDVQHLKTDVQQLKTDVHGLKTEMQGVKTELHEFGHRITRLETRQVASEQNSQARLHNSLVYSPPQLLEPLVNAQNEAIPGFPTKVSDIDEMSSPALQTVLAHLDKVAHGNALRRRDQLKAAVGMQTTRIPR